MDLDELVVCVELLGWRSEERSECFISVPSFAFTLLTRSVHRIFFPQTLCLDSFL